jgi:hypothetical protein
MAREVHDGEPCRVVTDTGVVRAKDVIVAAHVPVSNRVLLHTKITAYRFYAIAARIASAAAPRGLTSAGTRDEWTVSAESVVIRCAGLL